MLQKHLFIVGIIVLLNTLVLNSWGSDPVFVVGPSFSVIHGHFFQNTLAFYEQGFNSTYLYGIYAFVFLIKGLGFLPFKVYQLLNVAILVWAALLALQARKTQALAPLIIAAILSSAILTGPRFEVLPMTMLFLTMMLLERHAQLAIGHIAAIGLMYGALPMLHPMATLQGALLMLLYFIQKDNKERYKIIAAGGVSLLFFMVFVHFDIHNFLDFYTKGTGARDLERHYWRPALTLKFLKLHPLIVLLIGMVAVTTRSIKALVFLGGSLLLGQLLGRSYYGIYVLLFIVALLPSGVVFDYAALKVKYRWALGLALSANLLMMMIHPIQALENPLHFKAWNGMLPVARRVIDQRLADGNVRPQVWTGFRLAPGLYDVPNLRYYWQHTPELNGYGHLKPGDLVICTDRREWFTARRLAKGQDVLLAELPVDSVAAKGLLRTNLKRSMPIKLQMFEVTAVGHGEDGLK